MKKIAYISEDPSRVDFFVAESLNITRSAAQKKIQKGLVQVNGEQVKSRQLVKKGDEVEILERVWETSVPMSMAIIYEDENIIVVDKPAGIVTLDLSEGNSVFGYLRDELGHSTVRMVHRLDKDTSGINIFAKNQKAEVELKKLFKNREVRKKYQCLVVGHVEPHEAEIDIPLARLTDTSKIRVSMDGREAKTKYRVLKYYNDFSLLDVDIFTGRTHQIRVHLSSIGYPVAGDKVYGKEVSGLSRQFLHACFLGFTLFGTCHEFTSVLADDLNEFLESL